MSARGWVGLAGLLGVAVAIAFPAGLAGAPARDSKAPQQAFTTDIPDPAPAGRSAAAYYHNIQVLKQLPAQDLIPLMLQLRTSMGVDCSYCHAPHEWPTDAKTAKLKARTHFQMLDYLRDEHFDKKPLVTCWSCHRGRVLPESLSSDPEAVQRVATLINVAPADQDKPAEQVFKNIDVLKGVPAGRLPTVMALFSRSLGVRCTFCHIPDNYASDDKSNKKIARKMLLMVRGTLGKYYNGDGPVSCFTCHHGTDTPEVSPGKLAE